MKDTNDDASERKEGDAHSQDEDRGHMRDYLAPEEHLTDQEGKADDDDGGVVQLRGDLWRALQVQTKPNIGHCKDKALTRSAVLEAVMLTGNRQKASTNDPVSPVKDPATAVYHSANSFTTPETILRTEAHGHPGR